MQHTATHCNTLQHTATHIYTASAKEGRTPCKTAVNDGEKERRGSKNGNSFTRF